MSLFHSSVHNSLLTLFFAVFGFAQRNFVGREQTDAYVVDFGFLSGAISSTLNLSFEITFGTAGMKKK